MHTSYAFQVLMESKNNIDIMKVGGKIIKCLTGIEPPPH